MKTWTLVRNQPGGFLLQINGLDAFARFCAIIRGQGKAETEIRELTAALSGSTDALEAAVKDAAPKE